MKRKIFIVMLAVVLAMGSLVGCTNTETGYLSMMSDAAKIKSTETKGNIDLSFDAKAINTYFTKITGANLEEYFSLPQLEPNEKIRISYEGKIRVDNPLKFEMDFTVNMKGNTVDLGKVIFDGSKGYYVSKEFLTGILTLSKEFAISEEVKDYIDNVIVNLHKNMSGVSFVEIANQGAMLNVGIASLNTQYIFGQSETDFLKDTFKNYYTGAVTSSNGGYELSFSLRNLLTMAINSLEYILNNENDFINALEVYKKSGRTEKFGISTEAVDEFILNFKENKNEFRKALISAKSGIESMLRTEELESFMDSVYKINTTKTTNGLNNSSELNITNEGNTLINIITNTSTEYKDMVIVGPTSDIMSFEDLQGELAKIRTEFNPIVKAKINWYDYDENIWVAYERKSKSAFWENINDDYDYFPFIMDKQSLYIPLREVTEAFDEQLGWDKNLKEAYIIRGDKKIRMEGMLYYDKFKKQDITLVKLRDFEKLGYKVEYESNKEYGQNFVTMSK